MGGSRENRTRVPGTSPQRYGARHVMTGARHATTGAWHAHDWSPAIEDWNLVFDDSRAVIEVLSLACSVLSPVISSAWLFILPQKFIPPGIQL